MSNQASRFFVAASVLVLSLASFGGVQTNSVSAEVRALQAEYEAEPLTYPEPPFAPVSRLLDPSSEFLFAEHRGWLDACPDSFKLVVDSKGDKVQERKRQCRACKGTGTAGTRKKVRPCKCCGGTGEETVGGR